MKNLFFGLLLIGATACDGNKEKTGDEEKSMQTKTEAVDNTPEDEKSLRDSTPTTNNNAYNTDSASGQGTTYDTSSNNKGKQ